MLFIVIIAVVLIAAATLDAVASIKAPAQMAQLEARRAARYEEATGKPYYN